jgi:hypothetical protein
MFAKYVLGNTMRDTVANVNGDGYVALHNIMCAVHPDLIDKAVEPITPYQCNVLTIAAHGRNMNNHIEKEGLRGRLYTKYDSLLMVRAGRSSHSLPIMTT